MPGAVLRLGITDNEWFRFLSNLDPRPDEVNFWSPGGRLTNLPRGTPFLFKLKSPVNAIGGGGYVDYSHVMTIADAWEFYGCRNGAASLEDLRQAIARNSNEPVDVTRIIGCTVLSEPFFLSRERYLQLPSDFKSQGTQSGKNYDFTNPYTAPLLEALQLAAPGLPVASASPFGGVGKETVYLPRRGQGTFRRLVIEAYDRQCAVTGEHTLPVLQASHIKPFSSQLEHEVTNGIALRSDVHTLFDLGYVTVTPGHRFLVSGALRSDFANGKIYYKHHGDTIHVPATPALRPSPDYLAWHCDTVFKG